MRTLRLLFAAAVAASALTAAPALAATPSSPASAPAHANGIIMRDGGVCDPIRHMGC